MGDLVVAFSGGADSTAMALRLACQGERFVLLHTPTGDELPDVAPHVRAVAERVGMPLVLPPAPTLGAMIRGGKMLPNWRARWCTRAIKIAPCVAWLKAHPGSTLAVGLRADEPERTGLYGAHATYRYPLREWGWTRRGVLAYLAREGVTVPRRTDCARCYGQQLREWYELWRDYPATYATAVCDEETTGHTFRSAQRDTWPARLAEMGALFGAGRVPPVTARTSGRVQFSLPLDGERERGACRVCR